MHYILFFQKMFDFSDFFINKLVRPRMTTGLCMELMLVGYSLSELCDEMTENYKSYLRGKKCHKFSTEGDNSHFEGTRQTLREELKFFDYKHRISAVVQECPSRYKSYNDKDFLIIFHQNCSHHKNYCLFQY